MNRLFIGKLPHEIGREALEKHFSQYGTVNDVFLPSSNQGKAYAIAFVKYEDEKGAVNFVHPIHHFLFFNTGLYQALATEHTILGHPVHVTKAQPKGAIGGSGRSDNKRLFCGNLAPATTEMELTSHFSQFGNVVDVHIHAGKSERGYGYVSFSSSSVPL